VALAVGSGGWLSCIGAVLLGRTQAPEGRAQRAKASEVQRQASRSEPKASEVQKGGA
jgi:hypothetical protein